MVAAHVHFRQAGVVDFNKVEVAVQRGAHHLVDDEVHGALSRFGLFVGRRGVALPLRAGGHHGPLRAPVGGAGVGLPVFEGRHHHVVHGLISRVEQLDFIAVAGDAKLEVGILFQHQVAMGGNDGIGGEDVFLFRPLAVLQAETGQRNILVRSVIQFHPVRPAGADFVDEHTGHVGRAYVQIVLGVVLATCHTHCGRKQQGRAKKLLIHICLSYNGFYFSCPQNESISRNCMMWKSSPSGRASLSALPSLVMCPLSSAYLSLSMKV